jgi:hypothetical protein
MADLDLERVIDHGFAVLEQGVAEVGAALGIDLGAKAADLVEGVRTPMPGKSARPFRVDSVIDADSGREVFLVTDGAGASIDCPDRKAAESVLDALAAKGEAIAR